MNSGSFDGEMYKNMLAELAYRLFIVGVERLIEENEIGDLVNFVETKEQFHFLIQYRESLLENEDYGKLAVLDTIFFDLSEDDFPTAEELMQQMIELGEIEMDELDDLNNFSMELDYRKISEQEIEIKNNHNIYVMDLTTYSGKSISGYRLWDHILTNVNPKFHTPKEFFTTYDKISLN